MACLKSAPDAMDLRLACASHVVLHGFHAAPFPLGGFARTRSRKLDKSSRMVCQKEGGSGGESAAIGARMCPRRELQPVKAAGGGGRYLYVMVVLKRTLVPTDYPIVPCMALVDATSLG